MSQSSDKRTSSFTRREAIGLFGAGAAIATGFAGFEVANAATKRAASKSTKSAPIIRTLLKDIAPEELGNGSILFHEHLSLRYPVTRAMAEKQGVPVPPNYSDDVDLMVEETRAAGKDGAACIVDGG